MNKKEISHKLSILLVLAVAIFIVSTNSPDAYSKTIDFTVLPADANYVADELLIRFTPKSDGKQRDLSEKTQILSSLNGGDIKRNYTIVPGLTLVKLPPGLTVKDALKIYNNTDGIMHAQPNYKIGLLSTEPYDPSFYKQWGLHNTGNAGENGSKYDADIDAPEAWSIITDSNIIVAVIDTGVDYVHPDLLANIWTDPNGSGYHGHDFANNDNDPCDDHYHGTHVAGIIGAVGNNGIGISGVCWKVKIMALKFMKPTYDPNTRSYKATGATSDAIKCIEYAVEHGAKILNNSWGGGSTTYSADLEAAIQNAGDNYGALFIAAAGNYPKLPWYDNDITPVYPANYDCNNIISVMATDYYDLVTSFSHWGANTVDIAAPGLEIYSTMPAKVTTGMRYYDEYGYEYYLPTYYHWLDGTSMAAPYVAGACALVWANKPNFTHLQVKQAIMDYAEPLDSLAGKCVSEGRLNVNNAIRNFHPDSLVRNITQDTNYPTIQLAVNAADDNDVIVLDEGIYYEHIDINSTHATGLTIRSTDPCDPAVVADTIIDSGETSRAAIKVAENYGLKLEGLTIRNDKNFDSVQLLYSSAVTIRQCKLFCTGGRGVYTSYPDANIIGCIIDGRNSDTYGIYAAYYPVSLKICDSIVYDCNDPNTNSGCGIYIENGNANTIIRNNTIVNNNYGIAFNGNNASVVTNCIVWGNVYQIYPSYKSNVTYCCVQNGFEEGANIISSDPCFVDSNNNDYHLLENSPCINTGDPNYVPEPNETDLDGLPRIIGGRVDMGADEYSDNGDFNYDGTVNFKDYALLAKVWDTNQNGTIYDLDPNNTIDYWDLEIFVENWLVSQSGVVEGGLQGEQSQMAELALVSEQLLPESEQPLPESEPLLDEGESQVATISLFYNGNEPNEGDEVTVYFQTDMPLWCMSTLITVTGDANIITAMGEADCNDYGWDNGWNSDPYIDEQNGWAYINGVSWPCEANGIIGYLTFRYNGGEVVVALGQESLASSDYAEVVFSTEPLVFGQDPNK